MKMCPKPIMHNIIDKNGRRLYFSIINGATQADMNWMIPNIMAISLTENKTVGWRISEL